MVDTAFIFFFFSFMILSCALQIGSFVLIIRGKVCGRRSAAHALSLSVSLLAFFAQTGFVIEFTNNFLFICSGTFSLICFAYIFFHFDNMGETARRIRLLWELYEHPTGLSTDQLLECYAPEEAFQRRVDRLLQAGQCSYSKERLIWRGGSYTLIQHLMKFWGYIVFGPETR